MNIWLLWNLCRSRHYSLFYDHGWFIDFHTIRRAINDRTRAIVLVNPNNPTGHFLKRHELAELVSFGLPIISDEVFRDYPLDPSPDSVRTLQGVDDALVFTLNGLSKTVGLPQMKLAWMVASGPAEEALERLELIADTYLSVGSPVQLALPELLALRAPVQRQISERTRANLEFLRGSGLRVLNVEGGWYAIVVHDESAAVGPLLRDHDVLVQLVTSMTSSSPVILCLACSLRPMFSGKVFDDFNFAEAFFDRRRNQLCGHPIEHMPGDIPVSGCVARFADFQRHVEKDCFHLAVWFVPLPSISSGQVRCVNIRNIARLTEKRTHLREDLTVHRLVALIAG